MVSERPFAHAQAQSALPLKVAKTLDAYQEPYAPAARRLDDSDADLSKTLPLSRALVLLRGFYILAQNAQDSVLVEIHAAHECMLNERLRQAQQRAATGTQSLLVPLILTLRVKKEVKAAEQYASAFRTMGFELDRLGP